MQQYSTVQQRNLIMAERTMLKAAEPIKVLSLFGEQKEIPQNKTDTVVFRRALPIDAASNGAPVVNTSDYLLAEGVTPGARTLDYQDVQCTVQQYGVLMKISNKAESLYEDDIPKDMMAKVGEHMGTIEELIAYGVVRGGTNVQYANNVAGRANVAAVISLPGLRKVARTIEAAHGSKVTRKLEAGTGFGTSAIHAAYLVFVHTDLESDVRNLAGFTPIAEYGSQKPVHEREIGACEQFRFVTSPYFRPFVQAASAATGTTAGTVLSNGQPNSGNAPDVYPVIVVGKEAWGQVAVKGMGAIDPVYLPAKTKSHANPMGMFGYVGANFWKTAIRLNENWIVRYEVAASALVG